MHSHCIGNKNATRANDPFLQTINILSNGLKTKLLNMLYNDKMLQIKIENRKEWTICTRRNTDKIIMIL